METCIVNTLFRAACCSPNNFLLVVQNWRLTPNEVPFFYVVHIWVMHRGIHFYTSEAT